jgi:hypothetical protein
MKLVILESPFAGRGETVDERELDHAYNILFARQCLGDCNQRGESALVSHLLWPQALPPVERSTGIVFQNAWRRIADFTVFYTDRGWSEGMLAALSITSIQQRPFYLRGFTKPVILPPDRYINPFRVQEPFDA